MNKRQTKYFNQNLLDYVLTNYGSLTYLNKFMIDNNLKSTNDFNNFSAYYNVKPVLNGVINYYEKNNIIVNTGQAVTTGDFNIDFNNDFLN